MQDMIIKQTGNSRLLKSVADFKTLYPTYDDFAQALIDGTLPIDLAGLNPDGIAQEGTALNKANLLSDTTAGKFGIPTTAGTTLNDAFTMIATDVFGAWYILSTQDWTVPVTGRYRITVWGGGGSGGYGTMTTASYYGSSRGVGGGGGGAGYRNTGDFNLIKNDIHTITIGKGGRDSAGGATSFGTLLTASGGGKGGNGAVTAGSGSANGGEGQGSSGTSGGSSGGNNQYGVGVGGRGGMTGYYYYSENNYSFLSSGGGGGGGLCGSGGNGGTGIEAGGSGGNGTGFASGGGGGGSYYQTSSISIGGNGASGICIIELLEV